MPEISEPAESPKPDDQLKPKINIWTWIWRAGPCFWMGLLSAFPMPAWIWTSMPFYRPPVPFNEHTEFYQYPIADFYRYSYAQWAIFGTVVFLLQIIVAFCCRNRNLQLGAFIGLFLLWLVPLYRWPAIPNDGVHFDMSKSVHVPD